MPNIRYKIASGLLAIFMLVTGTIPAGAAGNCSVAAAAKTWSVPADTAINVDGVEGVTTIIFGDKSPSIISRSTGHIYYGVGSFKITATIEGNDGYLYRCHAYIVTTPYDGRDLGVGPGEPGFEIPTESNVTPPVSDSYVPVGKVEVEESFNDSSSDVDVTMGDNNVAPVVNGNENSITIEGDETTLRYNITNITIERPEPNVEAKVIAEPVKLTFGQRLWQLIISPFTATIDGISAAAQSLRDSVLGPELSSLNK